MDSLEVVGALKADARQRSFRTVIQGAIATVLVAVLPIVYTGVQSGLDKVNWDVLGWSAGTAAAMAFVSYMMAFLRPIAPVVTQPVPVVPVAPVTPPQTPVVDPAPVDTGELRPLTLDELMGMYQQ